MVEEATTADSMLGISFILQHSAARVLLEQLIYRWRNSRRTLIPILRDGDRLPVPASRWQGGSVTRARIRREINRLLGGIFKTFSRQKPMNTGSSAFGLC
jgi:hypothetical protein